MITSAINQDEKKGLLKPILIAWAVVGTLDLTAAVLQTLINRNDPMKMLQFISSGVFGMAAFQDASYSYAGILFHYCIALSWTVLFFLLYPRISFLRRNRIVTGILYGIFVWAAMNFVILPLSNTPALKFNLTGAIIAASILIIAMGLPLSFIAHRHYSSSPQSR